MTLLDEVGRFRRCLSAAEVSAWKQEIKTEIKTTHPAAERAAWLHVWLGEWELAQNQQPEQAIRQFQQAQHLTNLHHPCFGLAAYDQAIALFYAGAYADASDAFSALLSPKTGFPGYDRRSCALWLRHAQICAGTHDAHAKLGIPEPPRLDPLCGAASLAACLRSLSLPDDRAAVLKVCKVTGEGSTLEDVLNAARKLGLNARAVTADDQGLIALPKPLVAYVEQDHFVALVRADKAGVSYLCSDCGAWPGGPVNLTWAQWHALNPGVYGSVTRPGSASDHLLQAAFSPPAKPGSEVPKPGSEVRLSYVGSLSGLDLSSFRLKVHFQALASTLRHHVARYMVPASNGCGYKLNSLHCQDWVEGPMYRPGGQGDGPQQCDPVNLATGEEEYGPAPDLVVYNPAGPTLSWSRVYNSLRSPDKLTPPATVGVYYNPTDFGVGWSHSYNYRIIDPTSGSSQGGSAQYPFVLVLPNGATVPITGTRPTSNWNACSVPAGTPFRVDYGFQTGAGGSGTGYYFVVTMADRSRFIFYPAQTDTAGLGHYSQSVYLLHSIMDKNGQSVALTYAVGPEGYLATVGGTYAGINIQRYSDNSIQSVSSSDGRVIFYHTAAFSNVLPPYNPATGAYPANEQSYHELDNVSSAVSNTGQTNPFYAANLQASTFVPGTSRWTYGYTDVLSGDPGPPPQSFATLNAITVPSPASSGGTISPSTAHINYGTNFVTSLVDANNNATTFAQVTNGGNPNCTQVALKNPSGTLVYSYTVSFDSAMNLVTKTDGSNSTVVMTKTFSPTSADPYRPVSVTNGNGNTWQFIWDQYGNLHQTKSPRGTYTNYTWAFPTANSAVNSTIQANAPVLGELVSVQQGTKAKTSYTYFDTAYPGSNPLSPDSTNSGQVKTITTPLPGVPGATNSASYSFTYSGANPLTVVRPGNSATGTITTAYEYDQDYGDGVHNIPAYNPVTGSANPFTPNDYEHPLTVTEELYPLNSGNQSQNPVTHYRYDDQGHVFRMYDALGNQTDFGGQQYNNSAGYNVAGQLLQATYPATGQTGSGRSYSTFTYLYVGGPLTSTKLYDESGNLARQVNYTYGPEGELLNVSGSTEPVSYAYDPLYRLSALQDGNGHVTHYYYNAAGYLDSLTYPGYSGAAFPSISGPDSLHFTYDAAGNVATRTDGNGVVTSYTHTTDLESLLTAVQYSNPQGYAGSTAGKVTLTYDAYGRLSSMTDGAGTTNYGFGSSPGYDDLDNPLNIQTIYYGLPAQAITYSYYPDGSRKSMNTPSGQFTYGFDAIGRLTSLRNSSTENTSWQYYLTGWLQSQTDNNGMQAQATYNALGQIIDWKNSNGANILSEFGNQTQSSGIIHDAFGNETTAPTNIPGTSLSGTTTYTYDNGQTASAAANRNQVTQENSSRNGGYTNVFSYDAAGNPTMMRGIGGLNYNSDNQSALIDHDATGNVQTRAGMPLTYDPENRLTSVANQPSSTAAGVAVGADGQTRLLWNNADGSISLWTVSGIGNPNSSATIVSNWSFGAIPRWTARGVAVGADNLARILWCRSDGQFTIWTISSSGSIQSATGGLGPYPGWVAVGIGVGPDNVMRVLFNNVSGQGLVWLVSGNGSVLAGSPALYPGGSGWSAASLSIGPDNLTRILWRNVNRSISLWKITNLGTGAYLQNIYPVSDDNYQVASAISVGPNNKTRVLWNGIYGEMNLWDVNDWTTNITNGAYSYRYLYSGDTWMLQGIGTGSDDLTRLQWGRTDGSVALFNENESNGNYASNFYQSGRASGPTPALQCGYRGDGLRAWKQSNGVATYFLYDGSTPVCELNSSGQVTAINTFGGAGLISRDDSIATYYAYDERGSVAQRVSSSGSVLSSDLYDTFGNKLVGPASNWGFGAKAGYYTDPETGLIYLTNRYYDSLTGRFLSRDPSGYGGGINLYSYVGNNPGNSLDPLGLCGGDDAEPGFWDAVGDGLNVGVKATASALSFGLYDGGDAKCDPDFGTSKQLAGYGRDAAIMAATMGTAGEAIAAEEGAGATEGAAEEGAEAAEGGGCPWPMCFTADTPVQMADGTTKRIADVQAGDKVRSRDPQTGRESVKTVTATIKRLAPAVVTVSLTDAKTSQSETLTCTPEHPFFVTGQGWVEAGSLGIGTSIVSRAGPQLSVTNVAWHRNQGKELAAGSGLLSGGYVVYNLTIEDDHTFFVGTTGGGTWVHNINCSGQNFPDTPEEMNNIMGKAGQRNGGPSNQQTWEFNEEDGSLSRFRYENHPEDDYNGFIPRHTEPHFHYDVNGVDGPNGTTFTKAGTFLPGEPIP